jgi:hypothetical protein
MTVIICQDYKQAVQNTRQAYVDLALPDAGIVIKGAVVHLAPTGKRWIAWPAVPTGKGYASCFSFMATTERDAWQAAAVAAIDRFISGVDCVDAARSALLFDDGPRDERR